MRQSTQVGLALVAILALAGCSSPTSRLVYRGEQAEVDRLPEIMLGNDDADNYDLESARYLGAANDHKFWAVRMQRDHDCVAVLPTSDDWYVSCTTGGGVLGFNGAGVSGKFAADGFPASSLEDGWTSVHAGLRVAN
ncbi:hypothetical protein ACLRGF_02195 [Mycetocola zhadangensis]|uniref:hypothetical protein n=1 Tax=Mycetocola zhadangensis TaxID=1164595 RepID=UPI003A4DD6DB